MSFANTYNTTNPGSGTANREDRSDMMYRLAPEQTPIYSNADKIKISSTFYEWQVDTLAAPNTAGVSEGADVTAFSDKFSGAAKLGNYIQKTWRDYQVSDIQESVNSGGLVNIARSETKAIIEHKRDIEAILGSANDRSSDNGAGTPYMTRGLLDWIDSSGPSDVPADYRTPAASIHASGTFNEDVLGGMLASMFRQSGSTNDVLLIADTALRSLISKTFTRTSGDTDAKYRSVNFNGADHKISQVVETYQSDHGLVSIINANSDCTPDQTNFDTGYLLNTKYYCVGELGGMEVKRIQDLGGGPRGVVQQKFALIVKNPLALGKITTLS